MARKKTLHEFVSREAATTGQPKERLTLQQRNMLGYLDARGFPVGFCRGPKVAMLRRLGARGLVQAETRNRWSITKAGKALLPIAPQKAAPDGK